MKKFGLSVLILSLMLLAGSCSPGGISSDNSPATESPGEAHPITTEGISHTPEETGAAASVDSNPWSKLADMGTDRICHGMAEVNGKIYVIGGGTYSNGRWTNEGSVEEYDPATGKWSQKADMITPRGSFGIAVLNNNIYVMGGVSVENGAEVDYACVESYDPATDKWTSKKRMSSEKQQVGAAAVNGRIYVIGGNAGSEYDFDVYDPEKDEWTPLDRLPFPVRNPSVAAVNNKIYIVGGHHGERNLVAEYDPMKNQWTVRADLPTARTDLAVAVVDGNIYALGGLGQHGFTNAVEKYNIIQDSWSAMTPMSASKSLIGAAAVGNDIYVAGGTVDLRESIDTFERYETDKDPH